MRQALSLVADTLYAAFLPTHGLDTLQVRVLKGPWVVGEYAKIGQFVLVMNDLIGSIRMVELTRSSATICAHEQAAANTPQPCAARILMHGG